MRLRDQIILICIPIPLCFIFIRCVFATIKRYQMNKSALKKRKKDETFIQWLVYSKFKEEIPFQWRLFYYIVSILPFCAIISCVLLYFIDSDISFSIGRKIAVGMTHFQGTWVTIVSWMFHSRDKYKGAGVCARWIRKKRGMKHKK
ncbi:MAG: hypothetical protein E7673_05890 [Ruminococcaceae bacterium]|nr:hypothetical protein [Oscillospiraceae bacterium]